MENTTETLNIQQETLADITTALIHKNIPFTFTPGTSYARLETEDTTFTVLENGSFAQIKK